MKGGSEFDESDFLLFAKEIKTFTYNTYIVEKYLVDEPDDSEAGREYAEDVKKNLTDYKRHIKYELLDSYDKKSKFDVMNKMVAKASKDEHYMLQDVASSEDSEDDGLYDCVGLTEKILKKIGISYVLTEEQLDSIRSVLSESSSSSSSSSSSISSRTSSRGTKKKNKKKKPTTKKKKKKKTRRYIYHKNI